MWPGSWPRSDHHHQMSEGDLTEYGLRLRRLRISLIVRPTRSRLYSTTSTTSTTSNTSNSSCDSSSSSRSSSRSLWDVVRIVRRWESSSGDASGEFDCYSSRSSSPPLPPRQSQARPPALPPYPSSTVSLVNDIAKTILT